MMICVKSKIDDLKPQSLPDQKEFISLETELKNDHLTATKIVAKIFLNEYNENSIDEALENLLKSCITTPTVILAYHPTTKPTADNELTTSDKFSWGGDCATSKKNFKAIWKKLQAAASAGKIRHLGIADMDLDTILEVFDDKKFDFTILQINIATCCVVPPELQQFCKDHEIQLLTHSDPQGTNLNSSTHLTFKINSIFLYCRNISSNLPGRNKTLQFQR